MALAVVAALAIEFRNEHTALARMHSKAMNYLQWEECIDEIFQFFVPDVMRTPFFEDIGLWQPSFSNLIESGFTTSSCCPNFIFGRYFANTVVQD